MLKQLAFNTINRLIFNYSLQYEYVQLEVWSISRPLFGFFFFQIVFSLKVKDGKLQVVRLSVVGSRKLKHLSEDDSILTLIIHVRDAHSEFYVNIEL